MKHFFIVFIRVYQAAISPFFPRTCRFYPTCSFYAIEAIKKYGILIGAWKSFQRIIRCSPFSSGGYDPIK